jgi:hypothetical protein
LRWPTAGLAVLASGLFAAAVLLLLLLVLPLRRDVSRYNDHRRLETSVSLAARRLAVTFTGATYADPHAFTSAVLAATARGFQKQAAACVHGYEAGMATARAVDTPDVLGVAVISASVQVASALVTDDVRVATRRDRAGSVRHARLELFLSYQGGRWRVADIESVR